MKKIRLAEWVSLAISVLLIVAIVGYLVIGITREGDDFLQLEIKIERENSKQHGDLVIVPVKVLNKSTRAASHLRLKAGTTDLEIDYLPSEATEKLYLFVDKAELGSLKVVPLSYGVD